MSVRNGPAANSLSDTHESLAGHRTWLDDFIHGRPIDVRAPEEPDTRPKPKRRPKHQAGDGDVLQLFRL